MAPASWIVVIPHSENRLHPSLTASSGVSFSGGTCLLTSRVAAPPLRTPVGSPVSGSSSTSPYSGLESLVTPAISMALELATPKAEK